jgi:hypothetical protein
MAPVVESSGKTTAETGVDHDEFACKLRELEVPDALIDEAWTIVNGSALGVLLYGSWARRDAGTLSDLDLLLLSDVRSGTRTSGKVSVTFYSSVQLREAHRTLYGMHLARDGIILHDSVGELAGILSTFSPPDPDDLLRRVREFGVILDVTGDDRLRYLPGLAQVARYLLRTATYALALRAGDPCFSVEELAARFHQPELATLLSSHPGVYPEPTLEVLADLTGRLTSAVGPLPANAHGLLHALIVATSIADPDVSHLATFALGSDESLPYSEIPKVVL